MWVELSSYTGSSPTSPDKYSVSAKLLKSKTNRICNLIRQEKNSADLEIVLKIFLREENRNKCIILSESLDEGFQLYY